jgi:zeta-carotene isomerase
MTVQELEKLQAESGLIGEDAAVFDVKEQKLISWVRFLAVLGTVLTALYYLWINNDTGFGDDFVRALESLSGGDRSASALL